jgi:glycosyltransferase involved in cell wall biosynthesis
MIVQDEEMCINRSLDSIHDYVDEIIVVDGGSSDNTRHIAVSYPKVKLIDKPFNPTEGDRFDEHLNYTLDQCQYEWRLRVDADEQFPKDLMESLPMLMNPESIGLPYNTDAYGFSRRTFIDSRFMNPCNLDWQTRFFKNYVRYNGAYHEGVYGFGFRAFVNLHIIHDKQLEWQQIDNERVWDMGQEPPKGWKKINGKWEWTEG